MASKATLHARIVNTHDVETNWNKTLDFIPRAGEVIVYDPDDYFDYPRFKIGDGVTDVKELPFMTDILRSLTADHLFGSSENNDVIFLDAGNIKEYQ